MARKTKEILSDEEVLKKTTSKSVKKLKESTEKKTEKKTTKKKETVKKSNSSNATEEQKKEVKLTKVTKAKPSSTTNTSKKVTTKKTATKKPASQKSTAKKTTTKKSNSKTGVAKKSTTKKPETFTPEYYDLPYRYNQTIVKILAQTPSSLFIYWDISDEDKNHLKETYGEHIFEVTKPVLIIHNLTMNYSFEIDINDFANSWYLHINDSKCEYDIELGRRPIPINYAYINNYGEESSNITPVNVPYIYVSSSNHIKTPNDRILFNKNQKIIYFRNVKTNEVFAKDISNLVFISNIGRFYSISELYNKFFREDRIIRDEYILNNPGSGNPSSYSSSKFK